MAFTVNALGIIVRINDLCCEWDQISKRVAEHWKVEFHQLLESNVLLPFGDRNQGERCRVNPFLLTYLAVVDLLQKLDAAHFKLILCVFGGLIYLFLTKIFIRRSRIDRKLLWNAHFVHFQLLKNFNILVAIYLLRLNGPIELIILFETGLGLI